MNGRYEMAGSMNLENPVEWALDLRLGPGRGAKIILHFDIQILPSLNNVNTIEEAMALDGHCIHYALTQALWQPVVV
ncbi:hypothetical protein K7432_007517 [Basidiobolus ranarum]|uniref:Uncharacterized protein n=1 Tax=Basidiobolus ranarum TaxID=34480 RepID=A0ABR2W0X3_9FUNG